MTTSWKVIAISALALGQAFAADPAKTQDPPGSVGVDQPAGVSLPERSTERDATDTLRGGGRTDVIDGQRAGGRRSGPDSRPSESRGEAQPGAEARASFEGGPSKSDTRAPTQAAGRSSAAAPAQGSPAAGTGGSTADTSPMGTDHGYGTGTEPAPAR